MNTKKGHLVGSYHALRMEPPIDPPEEEVIDCPACEGEMKVLDHGRRAGFWWFKAECPHCGHKIDEDNFEHDFE